MTSVTRSALFPVLLLLAMSTVNAETTTIASSQSGYTQLPTGKTTVFSGSSESLFVGRNLVSCFRFEGVSVPKSALVETAELDIVCENCNNTNVRFSICGEYTQPSLELAEADFDLSDRQWARGCTSPTDYPSLNPQRFDVSDAIQDIVNNQSWTTGNAMSLCFLDVGSRAKNKVSSSASLSVTYDASGGGGDGGSGPFDCSLDTNGDGFVDLDFPDLDLDGYCDFPAGTVQLFGTIAFDRPFEINGVTGGGGGGVIFRGKEIRLLENGTIISDLLSPNVSTIGFDKGLDLTLQAESRLSLLGGLVSNLGINWVDEGGDLTFRTTLPNAKITIDGPLVLGEDIRIESNGALDIKGQTQIGAQSFITISALQNAGGYDIVIDGQTEIYTEFDIRFNNASADGKLIFGEGVILSAKTINLCGIKGGDVAVIGLELADIRGSVVRPGDQSCGAAP